jgi:hypothetical protein
MPFLILNVIVLKSADTSGSDSAVSGSIVPGGARYA